MGRSPPLFLGVGVFGIGFFALALERMAENVAERGAGIRGAVLGNRLFLLVLFDRRASKVQLSIKALEVAEEKEAIAQYGSSDSGATLGDILGTALKRANEKDEKADDAE